MSRTRKRLSWYLSPDGWTGRKQAERDGYRDRKKWSHSHRNRGGGHDNYWHLVRCLFAKGYSLEKMRKIFIEKHNITPADANKLIREFVNNGLHGETSLKIEVMGLVCVDGDHVVSAATIDKEPHFRVSLDLPIYFLNDGEKNTRWNGNRWVGGEVIYMNGKIYKFSPNDLLNKNRNSNYESTEQMSNSPIKIWPNERVTQMIGEIIDLYIDSGMLNSSYMVHGWKNIHYAIETKGESS
jgi:hypothetical protein